MFWEADASIRPHSVAFMRALLCFCGCNAGGYIVAISFHLNGLFRWENKWVKELTFKPYSLKKQNL